MLVEDVGDVVGAESASGIRFGEGAGHCIRPILPDQFPLPLALPVSFRPRRILLAQLRPVARVLRAPFLHAVQAHLPIQGIGGDLPPMVIATAPPLATRITASGLSRLKLAWLK